ncbi:hypothetical protein [Skermanella stibiiresistens]|uniref:hypothetical protein n=1 Tax=Skermanella stibiiresistens TaxID=913326 RepID=UPI0012FCC2DE|nr:hypothetical protein [Skermanella stibiiresistens]
MKKITYITLISTICITACVKSQPDAVSALAVQHTLAAKRIELVTKPKINELSQREVGETIIYEELEETVDAIVLISPVDFSYLNPARQIPAGTKFLHVSDTPTTKIYCNAHCLEEKDGVVSLAGEPNMRIAPSLLSFETVVTGVRPKSLQEHLVYTGRSGKTIFLSYREFSNDMARPAFTQDLTFEVSTDRIVGFRGARIEIVDAANTFIKYRVLTGFLKDEGNVRTGTREASKAIWGADTVRNDPGAVRGKAVVCKRIDGRVETMGESECAAVGKPL